MSLGLKALGLCLGLHLLWLGVGLLTPCFQMFCMSLRSKGMSEVCSQRKCWWWACRSHMLPAAMSWMHRATCLVALCLGFQLRSFLSQSLRFTGCRVHVLRGRYPACRVAQGEVW